MKIKNLGIGVGENISHCFILDITKDKIQISESFDLNVTKSIEASLNAIQWDYIKESVLYRIGKFITDNNYKKNRIITGENYINILLGKELTMLFWGIENTNDKNEIEIALRNWKGFEDSERWYFYTMTNANLNADKNRGWRGAIKKILIEN
jgi:hypothetical protein